MSMIGVISQRLLPDAAGSGRIAAVEVMVVNSAIRNMIREQKIHLIPSLMQSNTKGGNITLDDSLISLMRSGRITREVAARHAKETDRFLPSLKVTHK